MSAAPSIASPTITFSTTSAKDATVTVTPSDAFVRAVSASTGEVLVQNTDYTYANGTLTIKKEYLQNKKAAFDLKVQLTADKSVTVKATVSA